MALETPLGRIIVELNDKPCDYRFEELPKVILDDDGDILWSVEGRYKITPLIEEPLMFPLRLRCKIDTTLELGELSGNEGGERYMAMSMYHNGMKLCIGSYDDIDPEEKYGKGWIQVVGGGCVCWDSTPTSIEIYVGGQKYLEYAFFGIAWTTLRGDDFENNGDNDVWFLAEPAMS